MDYEKIAGSIQALCGDDELDLLAVSLPPGVGKTTLAIFLLTWIAGRDPNHPNLTGSHSNSFVRGVYSDYCNVGSKNGVGTPKWQRRFFSTKTQKVRKIKCQRITMV